MGHENAKWVGFEKKGDICKEVVWTILGVFVPSADRFWRSNAVGGGGHQLGVNGGGMSA